MAIAWGLAGIYLIGRYIYMIVPGDVIDEANAAADDGYSGISKNRYYLIKGDTMESSRLHRRNRLCTCDPCMKLKWGCIIMPRNILR